MGIVQIFKTRLKFVENWKPGGRCRQLVEDPIPDPEPAAPSLGYPDPGIFHHSAVYANTVLDIHAEQQRWWTPHHEAARLPNRATRCFLRLNCKEKSIAR